MGFYCFSQNNSGGKWHEDADRGIAHHVIIEGDDKEEILYRAGRIGLYFDGVSNGSDCSCCGDRWYPPYSSMTLDATPSVHKTTVEANSTYPAGRGWGMKWMKGPEGYIHYKDGKIEPFWS